MTTRIRFAALWAGFALLATGCPEDTTQPPDASACGCGTRVCGTDPCGNSCGTCTAPETCNASGQCVGLCESAQCNGGETCDEADGLCRCTETSCPSGKVCSPGLRCVDEGGPCATKVCADPTLPECNPTSGECECRAAPADSCGQGQQCVSGACQAVSKCDGVACNDGETCDEADGACKCTETSCPSGQVCSPGLRCVDEGGPCATKVCSDPTLPECNPTSGECECRASPTDSCGQGQRCVSGACQAVSKCDGVTCDDGETCDQADGVCKCSETSCPSGKVCSPNQKCVDDSSPCATKTCTGTTPFCEPVSGECQCVASPDSCGNGLHCVAGACEASVVVTECNTSLPAPAGGTCDTVAGSNAKILITGTVLLPGSVLRGGQVLVGTDGKIACVACDCSADASGATQVTCPDAVVSPGLINTHDHIAFAVTGPKPVNERYEHRHDWRHGLRGHTKISVTSSNSAEAVGWAELGFRGDSPRVRDLWTGLDLGRVKGGLELPVEPHDCLVFEVAA